MNSRKGFARMKSFSVVEVFVGKKGKERGEKKDENREM